MTKRTSRKRRRSSAKTDSTLGGYIPSGCSVLDMACTNVPGAGYRPGTMVNIVGDKHTGKTLLALSCLAEAATRDLPHRLKYYNTENTIGFDVPALFGDKLAERIEHERLTPPHLIEEWRDHMIDEAREEQPRIVVVDSIDSMSSESEMKQINEEKTAREKGKDVSGSYGTGKALINSQLFRYVMGEWEKNAHVLILISQTRDNIGSGFGGKTRSGGNALDFHAWQIMWLHHARRITREVYGNKVETGNETRVLLSKNKETGRQWYFDFSSYWDYGLDDTLALVDFLIKWKAWHNNSNGIVTPDIGDLEPAKKGELVKAVEENGLEQELRGRAKATWDKVTQKASPNRTRKKRFE